MFRLELERSGRPVNDSYCALLAVAQPQCFGAYLGLTLKHSEKMAFSDANGDAARS